MAVALYMDVHVHRAIADGLRLRGVDVLTAQEDGAERLDDDKLLDRTTALDRTLFTFDDDLLREARHRQERNILFAGVIYAHLMQVAIGPCIDDLELVARISEPDDLHNRVLFLPL